MICLCLPSCRMCLTNGRIFSFILGIKIFFAKKRYKKRNVSNITEITHCLQTRTIASPYYIKNVSLWIQIKEAKVISVKLKSTTRHWKLRQRRTLLNFMTMMLFRVLAPCRLVSRCQHFEETQCLHLQDRSWEQYVSSKRCCSHPHSPENLRSQY
jgi:hypothetical protein